MSTPQLRPPELAEVFAIVLAGGTARRLGGFDKATLTFEGVSLLDLVLRAVSDARLVAIVGPQRPLDGLAATHQLVWTIEDPPSGGPLAGLAAGVAALDANLATQPLPDHDPWVLVLACDQPFAAAAVPTLLAARDTSADAIIGQDGDGRSQPLLAAYRLGPLRRGLAEVGELHGAPMRALLSKLRTHPVLLPADAARDVDTWQDAEALGLTGSTNITSATTVNHNRKEPS